MIERVNSAQFAIYLAAGAACCYCIATRIEKLKLRGGSSSNRSLSADDITARLQQTYIDSINLGVMVPAARSARRNHQLTAIYLGN